MAENEGAWLTQDAYDKLKAELEHLSGPYRQEIIDRISAARDEGDLKENGGYHAAREEQGKNEGRIKQLQHLLETAQVSDKPAADDGVVEPGMVVEANIAGKTMTFLLGSREVADTLVGGTDLQVFSEKSPMGAAINGHKVGDELSYEAPNGKQIPVKIVSAKPFQG
ncbi:transcription elongation factor GreA [Rothia sp. SD9660Na]|uniref:transcription elongation factor GreA n=1 Tax=Rothia sp. SD9660Na TaxID=3047030 RepID=UPI0024BBC932|nr:transcription elongation factor GreA [Rothia sp. SD9660Na]WHS50061.1 transcription elongation factor GreA [Rothia sp. SD9660Na]